MNLFCLILGVLQSHYSLQFFICLRHTSLYFESSPTSNKAEQFGVRPTMRLFREEAVIVPREEAVVVPDMGFVWQGLSAHAEGMMTRLGSLQNPTVFSIKT